MSIKDEVTRIAREAAEKYPYYLSDEKRFAAYVESAIWTALRSDAVGFKEALECQACFVHPSFMDCRGAEAKLTELKELEELKP